MQFANVFITFHLGVFVDFNLKTSSMNFLCFTQFFSIFLVPNMCTWVSHPFKIGRNTATSMRMTMTMTMAVTMTKHLNMVGPKLRCKEKRQCHENEDANEDDNENDNINDNDNDKPPQYGGSSAPW